MEIKKVENHKKQFLSLLLLADEQEDMVDKYIDKGVMYVLDDNGIKGECVITDEGGGVLEIKNIAIPKKSRKPNSCLDSVCGSLFMLSLLP